MPCAPAVPTLQTTATNAATAASISAADLILVFTLTPFEQATR